MDRTRGLGPTQSWQVIGPRRLTLRIREEILREIDERRLAPGDRLPSERELAELLQVSRPSVREAVTALEVEGRLEVVHGRGVFVAEPETSRRLRASLARHHHDLSELFMMREALEVPGDDVGGRQAGRPRPPGGAGRLRRARARLAGRPAR